MREWRTIGVYLGLVTLLSGVVEATILAMGQLGAGNGSFAVALMWMPALAAYLTCRIRGIPLGELGWGWPARRFMLAGYFIPLAYCVVAYGAVWASPYGGFPDDTFVAQIAPVFHLTKLPRALQIAVYVGITGTAGMIRSLSSALGEEIGWRGLLVPQLARVMSPARVAIVSGIVWALYHVPLLVFGDYNAGTPAWWGMSCFAVMIVATSFTMAWLRLASKSVWPCAMLHAAHNIFVQAVFTPLTRDTGHTRWVVDEFGIALAIAISFAAAIVWMRWPGRAATPA